MARDRTTWIVVILAGIGLIASLYWNTKESEKQRLYLAQQQAQQRALQSANPTPVPTPTIQAPVTPAPAAVSNAPKQEGSLKNEVAELQFSNALGGAGAVDLLHHKLDDGKPVQLSNPTAPAIGAITQIPGQWDDSGYDLKIDQNAGTATFARETSDHLQVNKVFTLDKQAGLNESYQTKLSITFKNTGTNIWQSPGYYVSTGSAQAIHPNDQTRYTNFDWFGGNKFNKIDVLWFNASTIPLINIQTRPAQEYYTATADKIAWAGVSSQYFTTILASEQDDAVKVWAHRFTVPTPSYPQGILGIEGALGTAPFSLKPGESRTFSFTVYAGPKELTRLGKLPNDARAVMDFGWIPPITEALLTSMNTLHAWVGSYALAIIILTLVIRGLLWPIQNASMKSMRKMSTLQPEVTKLREKYKDDPQRMNQEMMQLYKKYGVNPVAGCLPMLVQIPIFFSFYSMLGSAIELRNSSFLWVKDLSQPDTVAHVFGFPLNILPLVMAVAQFWQMQITPKTGDPSTRYIFYITPIIFVVFCYNYASGLALYWSVSTIFTIIQTYLTRNQTAPQLKPVAANTTVAKKKSSAR